MTTNKLFGILAHPAGHSMSPLMHNTAFAHLGLGHHYHAFDVPPQELPRALAGLRALGISGVNVTIPHKEAVIPFLDEIDEEAKLIGAVNTIVLEEDGRLKGYNTDGAGYVRSLVTETELDLTGANILLLGAGGAAKGISIYLLKEGCPRLTIANRTSARAKELEQQLLEYIALNKLKADIDVQKWEEVEHVIHDYNVIINTTPMGMWPNVNDTPISLQQVLPGTIVSDIVYNPLKTKFLQIAEEKGAIIHEGLGMFVYQGAIAFELFTGETAPVEIMRKVVLERLKKGNE